MMITKKRKKNNEPLTTRQMNHLLRMNYDYYEVLGWSKAKAGYYIRTKIKLEK